MQAQNVEVVWIAQKLHGTASPDTTRPLLLQTIYPHAMVPSERNPEAKVLHRRAAFATVLLLACTAASAFSQMQTAVPDHLVWSDEFSGPSAVPDPANWKFETGGGGWGNHELETYCAPVSASGSTSGPTKAPCSAAQPNVFVSDGALHIVARRDAATGAWTSARLTTQGLRSFQYGRIEARIRIPSGAGIWPAFWMLGDDIATHPWPACGELDIMENIGKEPGKIHGSIHGTGFTGTSLGKVAELASGKDFAAAFHTYGLIWSPGKIQYYVDDPEHPYATFTPADLPPGAVWPFDDGRFFVLLNLAVGGDWPGPPAAATRSPSEMLVDYVRVYQNVPPQAGTPVRVGTKP